jgi:hypothetical protein
LNPAARVNSAVRLNPADRKTLQQGRALHSKPRRRRDHSKDCRPDNKRSVEDRAVRGGVDGVGANLRLAYRPPQTNLSRNNRRGMTAPPIRLTWPPGDSGLIDCIPSKNGRSLMR